MTAPTNNKAKVRLTEPGQLVASIPTLLGFTPTDSLVVICCHEPRGRVGLTMRIDLPAPESILPAVAELLSHIERQDPSRLVLLTYSDRRQDELMGLLLGSLDPRITITEATHVTGDRFWSYTCTGSCCPPEGSLIPGSDVQVTALQAETAGLGRATFASRDDLQRCLTGPSGDLADEMRNLIDAAETAQEGTDEPTDTYIRRAFTLWEAAAERLTDPRAVLQPAEAAALNVTLRNLFVRDLLAALDPASTLPLLRAMLKLIPAPYDAPIATLFAWVRYLEGAGPEVSIALERAQSTDPAYSMAGLLSMALSNALPPSDLNTVSQRAAETIRQGLGW